MRNIYEAQSMFFSFQITTKIQVDGCLVDL